MGTGSVIGNGDVLLRFAEVAAHQGYVRPVLQQENSIEIIGGRPPVVEFNLEGDAFIPNDTRLESEAEDGARIFLLTGPNMAGKSNNPSPGVLFPGLTQK